MDVAVVGSGPAGASAAYVLASHGLSPLLIERSRHPRDKVCGEACTPRAVRSLQRMGLLAQLAPQGASVRRAVLISPSGRELQTDLPVFQGQALVVSRRILDAQLVERAVAAGARLVDGRAVERVERHGRKLLVRFERGDSLQVDLVLGCDGVGSVVRRSLGAPKIPAGHRAFAIRAIFEDAKLPAADALTVVWERSLLPAYGWIFPLPGGRANVGIGIRADRLRAKGQALPALFERFLAMPRVREALAGAQMAGRAQGHPLPYSSSWGPCVMDGAMLAGDAAGLVNPLTGEGIDLAIESGELAGEVGCEALARGDASAAGLRSYQRLCEATFGRVLRLNGWLGIAFAVPWVLDRLFKAGRNNARLRQDLAQIALGGQRAEVTSRMIAALVFA